MIDPHDNSPSADDLTLTGNDRITLLRVARDSIRHGLDFRTSLTVEVNEYSPVLQTRRATFVTLRLGDALRGCIGTLEARRSLVEDVAHNAFAAAFRDSRFSPLTDHEFLNLHIHISILSPPVPMQVSSEEELLAQLRPGVDGLILEEQPHRATFLPDVWEMIKSPHEFVAHLKAKGGWAPGYWSPSMKVWRYTSQGVE